MDTFEDHYDEGKDPLRCEHKYYDKNLCLQCTIDQLRKENRELRTALDNMTEVARLAQEAAATAETRAVTRCLEIISNPCLSKSGAARLIRREFGL